MFGQYFAESSVSVPSTSRTAQLGLCQCTTTITPFCCSVSANQESWAQKPYTTGHSSIQFQQLKNIWKNQNLISANNSEFSGNSQLPVLISLLETPYQFLCYFCIDDLLENIVTETCCYSIQNHLNFL
jgi:hypothetical protein